jgi:hypothetical protein
MSVNTPKDKTYPTVDELVQGAEKYLPAQTYTTDRKTGITATITRKTSFLPYESEFIPLAYPVKVVIQDYHAVISYDEEQNILRGKFSDLPEGADFCAPDFSSAMEAGSLSLSVFLATSRNEMMELQREIKTYIRPCSETAWFAKFRVNENAPSFMDDYDVLSKIKDFLRILNELKNGIVPTITRKPYMKNVDSFYKHYEEMLALIEKVPDEDLRQDIWEKLTWIKCDFDCYRGQQEPDDKDN